MIGRWRLVDAVAVAAGALLCLKVLGLASGAGNPDAAHPNDKSGVAAQQNRAFAQALVQARKNYQPPDVLVTNAVRKPGETPEQARPGASENADSALPASAAATATSEPGVLPPSPSERAILERLGERREEWQKKGKDIDLRERLLEDAHRKLEARINDLKALEEKAESEAAKRGESETANLKNLVTMYESMKPKDAARIFDRLSHDVLVPVVVQMNPRKMSEVLAVMAPEAAERLTVALATRSRTKTEPAAVRPGLPPNELQAIEPPAKP